MSDAGIGDRYLARLMSRPAWAHTLYTLFALTALAALLSRVGLGRTGQVLPWYLALGGAYGFIMAALSRGGAARLVWSAFGLLVAASFPGPVLMSHPRLVGAVQAISAIVILAGLRAVAGTAVLESGTSETGADPGPQERDGTGHREQERSEGVS